MKTTDLVKLLLRASKELATSEDQTEHVKDHGALMEKVAKRSDSELQFAINDLKKVIKVQEDGLRKGMHTPKLGYYQDELHYCLMEQAKRKK